jgi:hypothetical protein
LRDSLRRAPSTRAAAITGGVVRFADVSLFAALEPDPGDRTGRDLAALAGPGALVPVPGLDAPLPAGRAT